MNEPAPSLGGGCDGAGFDFQVMASPGLARPDSEAISTSG